jgi:hypothetical protein
MVGNLEERLVYLGIAGNKSAEDIDKLKNRIFEVSNLPDIRISPDQLLSAVEQIVEKTGDLEFAKRNLKNFAMAIRATGAQGLDIGGIAAEFQKMGLLKDSEVLQALDILTVQGKEGAFTLQNLAALGPRVVTAYTALGRSGLPAIRELGAALQVIRQGAGGPEAAATTFEALLRVFGDNARLKNLKKLGVQVFDKEGLKQGKEILRPINELMVEIVKATQGRGTVLDKVIGDAEAQRAFKTLMTEFQNTGKIEGLKRFYEVNADGGAILEDSARAARAFNAAMTSLKTSWEKFADRELGEPVKDLADYLNALEPGTVQRWLEISKYIAIIGGSAIALAKIGKLGAFLGIGAAATPLKLGTAGGVGYGMGWLLNAGMGKLAEKASGGAYKGQGWLGEMMWDNWHTPDGKKRDQSLLMELSQGKKEFGAAKLDITVNDERVLVKRMDPGGFREMTVDTGRTMQGQR